MSDFLVVDTHSQADYLLHRRSGTIADWRGQVFTTTTIGCDDPTSNHTLATRGAYAGC